MEAWVHPHIPRIEANVERCVSVKFKGQHIAYFGTVLMEDVEFRIHRAGRERTLSTGHRNVHAWAIGEVEDTRGKVLAHPYAYEDQMGIVTYNPFVADHFYDVETEEPVTHTKFLWAAGKTFYYVKE